MKATKISARQRAQVVELLRCAADIAVAHGRPIATARFWLGQRQYALWNFALNARESVGGYGIPSDNEQYRAQLLEAAARVESEEWP